MSTPYGTSLVLFVTEYLVWDRTTSSVVTLCISRLWSTQIDVGVTVDVVHRFDTSLKFVAWVETDRLRDLSTFVCPGLLVCILASEQSESESPSVT